jgi:hypothetical protein
VLNSLDQNQSFIVKNGELRYRVAFDLGFEFDLHKLSQEIKNIVGSGDDIRSRPVMPSLKRNLELFKIDLAETINSPSSQNFLSGSGKLTATFYSIGAMSLDVNFPLNGDLSTLVPSLEGVYLSSDLAKNIERIGRSIFEKIKKSIIHPAFSTTGAKQLVLVIRNPYESRSAVDFMTSERVTLAGLIMMTPEKLAQSQIDLALSRCVTYSERDLVIVSDRLSVIYDEEPHEALDVLELANLQAGELSYQDSRLEQTFVELYEAEPKNAWGFFYGQRSSAAQKLNIIHLDSVIIADRVEQSFKISRDSYLSRIHVFCVEAMFLKSVIRGINRKLEVIRDVIDDIYDRQATRRMEILEWIIIILILIGTLPIFLK